MTFFFSDIEGSTRAWEQHRTAMPAALARHQAVVRGAIDGRGGTVVKDTGDGVFAVFRCTRAVLSNCRRDHRRAAERDVCAPSPDAGDGRRAHANPVLCHDRAGTCSRASSEDWEREEIIAGTAYYVDPKTRLADVAIMVHPDWQGLGLGTAILRHTADYAREHGLRGFTADILCDNHAMVRTLENLGLETTKSVVQGAYEVSALFGT